MSSAIVIHKGRTASIPVSLGIDVSADTLTSEIRTEPRTDSPLIATFTVTKVSGGTTGEIVLGLDDLITAQITVAGGFMDLKRVSAGEALAVFSEPLEVVFRGTVTQ